SAQSPPHLPRTRSRSLPELMTRTFAIFRRELRGYFVTPLAYLFIVIFLVLAGVLTFFVGNFFDRGQADLQPFFTFHPWLYLVLLQSWAPSGVIRAVAGISLFAHFAAITRGVVAVRDLVYFLSIIVAFLAANAVLIDLKKAD